MLKSFGSFYIICIFVLNFRIADKRIDEWRYKNENQYKWERSSYEECEQLYGLITRIYLVDDESCDKYTSCKKYEAFLPNDRSDQHQYDDIISFERPQCTLKC